jgi:biopolymer transport protein ExbD
VQLARPGALRAAINVTPLVDVVLVLLIVFMVLAPQLLAGPAVELPETERPPETPDEGRQVRVTIEHDGTIWVENERTSGDRLEAALRDAARRRPDAQVVIQADARLSYGEVHRAMLVAEAAGLADVGLITQRRADAR